MSALSIPVSHTDRPVRPQFHLVEPGEVPARCRRQEYARAVARAQSWAAVRLRAALVTVTVVFAAAGATVAWAFWSVPNLPLP